MFTNKKSPTKPGFTLIELLVAMVISGLLIALTSSIYFLFRKSAGIDQSKADLSQNARIALDRLSRELRQTPYIVTEFPADPADNSIAQPNEIEFENGHAGEGDSDYLTYKRYYLDGSVMKLQIKEYYFNYNPTLRVHQNDIGTGGISPTANILSSQDISENITGFSLYGSNLIQIIINTADANGQNFELRSSVLGRNI